MKVFVLLDPGEHYAYSDEQEVKVFQSKEKLYTSLVKQIEKFDCSSNDDIDSAKLLFDKGDFGGILDLYQDLTDVRLYVYETVVIK